MIRRRIFLWIGLVILLASWGFCRDGQASSTYHVRQGDSERIGVTPAASRAANHLTNSNLKPRQVLVIPVPSVAQTKPTKTERRNS